MPVMLTGAEIRKRFLEYFEKKGHKVVESDLLVPRNDPTLLFTGAGMNQFKEQFMGKNVTYKRACSSQKCLRTGDLENVGRTPRHHTFFEMLGNFSFGDYFKKEAIAWAWEFMTGEMGIPGERLWVSVYKDDDEAFAIWRDEIKVPERKIVKLGEHDNFWPADAPSKGPNGPCGPCSEIFYDFGENTGCGKADCGPACDCGRFIEVWNLVFTQFDRQPDGSLPPLPARNIDTGMGLERITAVMQGVRTNFDTDLFIPLRAAIRRAIGREVRDEKLIADHIRAAVFAIADGVPPSNEKQGYVIRKLIRRAYLKSGMKAPFLYNMVPGVASMFKEIYPELDEKREHISSIVLDEEKRFSDTLRCAMPVFEEMAASCKGTLGGSEIFKLVDTYGLPIDIISEEAQARGMELDTETFDVLMEKQKEQSRKGSDISTDFIFKPDKFREAPKPSLSDVLPLEARIEFILRKESPSEEAAEGERVEVITSPQSSRFYAESGGQSGDKGAIEKTDGWMRILNTYETDGRKVYEAVVERGTFFKGDAVKLCLDREKNSDTAKNHTATHLLQAALRNVLGDHVKQSGSLVTDERLRFDFTHLKKMSERELSKVEEMVNMWVEEGVPVAKEVKD
ncbi:MAG: alanine--tRNA ligase [Candidatus Omnitrophica bacterium]|nr:alanine--tRNA ligase [Candidatus Omnitrophota bacterium]